MHWFLNPFAANQTTQRIDVSQIPHRSPCVVRVCPCSTMLWCDKPPSKVFHLIYILQHLFLLCLEQRVCFFYFGKSKISVHIHTPPPPPNILTSKYFNSKAATNTYQNQVLKVYWKFILMHLSATEYKY